MTKKTQSSLSTASLLITMVLAFGLLGCQSGEEPTSLSSNSLRQETPAPQGFSNEDLTDERLRELAEIQASATERPSNAASSRARIEELSALGRALVESPAPRNIPELPLRPVDSGTQAEASARPSLRLALSPGDLMTSVRGTIPSALLLTGELTEQQVLEIQESLTLVTWPEREPVATSQRHRAPRPSYNDNQHHFELVPDAALADRWYAIVIDANRLQDVQVLAREIDGAFVSRFHPGSQPVVRSVTVTPGDSRIGLGIRFSERISDTRPITELIEVTVEGERLLCEPGAGPGMSHPQGAHGVTFQCPPFDLGSELNVHFAPDLTGQTGRRLIVPFGPSSMDFRFLPSSRDVNRDVNERAFRARP